MGAYTGRKIFEARPAPGTQQAGPPLPAMCMPSQVLLGGHCCGRGPWGFCCWGIWASGWEGGLTGLMAPFLLPAENIPG